MREKYPPRNENSAQAAQAARQGAQRMVLAEMLPLISGDLIMRIAELWEHVAFMESTLPRPQRMRLIEELGSPLPRDLPPMAALADVMTLPAADKA